MRFLLVLLIGLIISTILGIYTNNSELIAILDILSFTLAGIVAFMEERQYWRERGIE